MELGTILLFYLAISYLQEVKEYDFFSIVCVAAGLSVLVGILNAIGEAYL